MKMMLIQFMNQYKQLKKKNLNRLKNKTFRKKLYKISNKIK